MNHQPFEDWIMSEYPLSSEEQLSLEKHLSHCKDCQELQTSWHSIHTHLLSAPVVTPLPGIVGKWTDFLHEKRILSQKKQTQKMVLLTTLGTFLVFIIAMWLTILSLSPADLIISIIKPFNGLISFAITIQAFMEAIFGFIPPVIPVFYWIMITTWFCLLAGIWLFSIWRISIQGVYSK